MLENQNQNSESMLNSSLFDNLVGSLFDAVPEGVLIVDKSAKIVYINERMRELWNFPKEMSNFDKMRCLLEGMIGKTTVQISEEEHWQYDK